MYVTLQIKNLIKSTIFMISNKEIFKNSIAQTSESPVMFEPTHAEGLYIFNSANEKYIDLISGISVSNIGHRHEKVTTAIKEQVDKYLHLMVYGEYIQSPQTDLASKICSLLPESLNNIYFVNSGSEAVEGALKIAKKHCNREEVICFNNAYHGSTLGAISLIGNKEYVDNYAKCINNVKRININNIKDLETITTKTACVIIELIQGEAGIIECEKNYIKALKARCEETKTLIIVDEIQTGFGRTGTFFAFEQYDFTPDIITIAKGMGGGMPIGAFIANKEIMNCINNNPVLGHITTFGGHPVSCAASSATIDVIIKEKLIETVESKKNKFISLLKHPKIKNIRSKGLLIALDFEDEKTNFEVIKQCYKNNVLSDWFLFNTTSMRIAPPLTITDEEIELSCERIIKSINTTI